MKESVTAMYIQEAISQEAENNWPELLDLDTTCERLQLICMKSAKWLIDNYYCGAAAEMQKGGLDKIIARLIEMGKGMGDIDPTLSTDDLVRQFMGFYYISILTFLQDPKQNLFAIFDRGLEIFYRGVRPECTDTALILNSIFF